MDAVIVGLVGLYILDTLKNVIRETNIGLYRNNVLWS